MITTAPRSAGRRWVPAGAGGELKAACSEQAALWLREGGLPTRYLPRDIGIGRPSLQTRLAALSVDRLLDRGGDAGVLRRPDVFLLGAQTVYAAAGG